MLFHEPVFLYGFLPACLGVFLALRRAGLDALVPWFLLVASLVFYGWWDPRVVPLLGASILANHAIGRGLAGLAPRAADRLLLLGVAGNLALLALFKYADFAVATFNGLAGTALTPPGMPLPLGVSFFTFLQIAYIVDCRRHAGTPPGLRDYALFVSFFPHLIAGPLVHHRELIPQFGRRVGDELWENLAVGSTIFLIGLGKKTLLAQPAGVYADQIFAAAASGAQPTLIEAWVGAFAFAFQIYFDFSAYSDMAIGLSRLFGIRLPVNFESPYQATSIIEFWRRWHVTLSRFLRDYLYVALGGNRRGPVRRLVNVMIVMLLGGLWHGAGWNFVVWGGLHGALLVLNHLWRTLRGQRRPDLVSRWSGRVATFLAVVALWVPFRADTTDATLALWHGMAGFNGIALPEHYAALPGVSALAALGVRFTATPLYGGGWQLVDLGVALAIVWLMPNTQQIMRDYAPALGFVADTASRAPRWRPGLWAGALTGLAAVFLFARTLQKQPGEFIYFQF